MTLPRRREIFVPADHHCRCPDVAEEGGLIHIANRGAAAHVTNRTSSEEGSSERFHSWLATGQRLRHERAIKKHSRNRMHASALHGLLARFPVRCGPDTGRSIGKNQVTDSALCARRQPLANETAQ